MTPCDIKIMLLVLILIFSLYYNFNNKSTNETKYFDIGNELNKKIDSLHNIISNTSQQLPSIPPPPPPVDIVNMRDRQVVNDELYPLYGRTERPVFDMLLSNQTMFNSSSRGSPDTFRPVGLAKDKETGETYYLMGRQQYYGSSNGNFYLSSTNALNKLKINLVDRRNMPLIRDIYNIPDQIKIETGIFHGKEFEVEELKNANLTSSYY